MKYFNEIKFSMSVSQILISLQIECFWSLLEENDE